MDSATNSTTPSLLLYQHFPVMPGDYFVFHIRILLHYVLGLLWVPWIISTIFVFVEEDPHSRLYTGIATTIYTAVVFFWGFM
jgi:hypothetical protein